MNQKRESLLLGIIRDLRADVRCALRDGMPEYAEKCRAELVSIYRNRHACKIGRYGWPEVSK
jgi:hypothetical protein